jgi:N-acetylglucosaminyldiphosphoundecaprenol N-acetyl-beta-D-mannosaminyltransferase
MKSKNNLFGIGVDAVDYDFAVAKIIESALSGRAYAVTALAVHGLMTGVREPAIGSVLNGLDLVCPDGQPVRWALNLLHHAGLSDRVYGPTLTLRLCERAARESVPVFFYGSNPETLAALTHNLQARYPALKIAGTAPSRFRVIAEDEMQEIAREIMASGAKLVFCGLGCPRQEIWVHRFKSLLPMPLVAVGAAFDFHAGVLPQAPRLLQNAGLEWLFRLVCEPRRLWKRYLLLNPLFIWHFTRQGLGHNDRLKMSCGHQGQTRKCPG